MSGSLRLVNPRTPLKTHDHWDMRMEGGMGAGDFTIHGASAACIGTRGDSTRCTRCSPKLAPEPLSREFDGEYLAPRDPQAQRRHQTPHHEFPGRRGSGQHLCERGLVSGAGLARTPRRPAASPVKRRQKLAQAIKDVLGEAIQDRRHKLARLRQCRRRSPGYFRQKLFVYERAGRACPVCRSAVQALRPGPAAPRTGARPANA